MLQTASSFLFLVQLKLKDVEASLPFYIYHTFLIGLCYSFMQVWVSTYLCFAVTTFKSSNHIQLHFHIQLSLFFAALSLVDQLPILMIHFCKWSQV